MSFPSFHSFLFVFLLLFMLLLHCCSLTWSLLFFCFCFLSKSFHEPLPALPVVLSSSLLLVIPTFPMSFLFYVQDVLWLFLMPTLAPVPLLSVLLCHNHPQTCRFCNVSRLLSMLLIQRDPSYCHMNIYFLKLMSPSRS